MENEEKNINDTFTDMVKVELNNDEKIEITDNQKISEESAQEFDDEISIDAIEANLVSNEINNVEQIISSGENNQNSNKKRNNKSLIIILIIIILAALGFGGYFVWDKYLSNNNKKESGNNVTPTPIPQVTPTPIIDDNNKADNTEINVEIKDNKFYVNGNMVDFYTPSEVRANNYAHSEEEFYCNGTTETVYEYEKLNNVLFVNVIPCNTAYIEEHYFVDANGKILKRVNGYLADITLSFNNPLFMEVVKVDGNSIYLRVRDAKIFQSEQAVCDKINAGEQSEPVIYVDKITYSDGQFNLEKAVETTSYEQYRNERNVYCPEVIKEYDQSKEVEGTDGYNKEIAVIKDNRLLLLNNRNEVLSELATLDSNNYKIYRASIITTEDKLCKVSQNGTYIFVTNGLQGNDEKLYAVYYNGKSGNKSDLIESDVSGNFGNLITCK